MEEDFAMTIPGFKKCPHHDHYQYAESNAECPLCVADRNNPPQREMTLGEILPLLQGKTIKIATMELGDIINRVINVLLFLVGALSVVFIIVAGIYFSISNGNAEQVKRAKNTMTYAVIGLIVSILSYAIVNFVITIF
jgi:hypothetical protein